MAGAGYRSELHGFSIAEGLGALLFEYRRDGGFLDSIFNSFQNMGDGENWVIQAKWPA